MSKQYIWSIIKKLTNTNADFTTHKMLENLGFFRASAVPSVVFCVACLSPVSPPLCLCHGFLAWLIYALEPNCLISSSKVTPV